MIDGIKKGVAEAVRECRAAGVSTVMITGDHVRTAFAIARRLDITDNIEEVISGEQLDALSGKEREKAIVRCKVFARVS